jgi:hypothetical protein
VKQVGEATAALNAGGGERDLVTRMYYPLQNPEQRYPPEKLRRADQEEKEEKGEEE